MRSRNPKHIGLLIIKLKKLLPELQDCSENEIITICISNKINEVLRFVQEAKG